MGFLRTPSGPSVRTGGPALDELVNRFVNPPDPYVTTSMQCGFLNPWQVNCAGMDDTAVDCEFGRILTLWGGSCGIQWERPFGTPQEVRAETRRRIDELAPGGGFLFAPVHVLQAGVPPSKHRRLEENLAATRQQLMTWH